MCFLKQITWFLLAIWLDITQRQTHTWHTGSTRLACTYTNILTSSIICRKHLRVFYWMDNLLIQKFTLLKLTISLLLLTWILIEMETNNILKDHFRKGKSALAKPPVLRTTKYFNNTSLFMWKFWTSHFLENFENSKPCLPYKGEVGSSYDLLIWP